MKILLAVDDDRESYRAALAVSRWLPADADVVALHVGPVPETTTSSTVGGYAGTYPMVDVKHSDELSDQAVTDVLESARRAASMVHGEARTEEGDEARTIRRVAEEIDADLIVVGTGDRTWLSRLFSSSVSADVAAEAPCSVLVVRD